MRLFILRMLCLFSLSMSATVALADREASDDERLINDPRVQHLSYVFPETGETIPYALFVPSS